MGQCNFLNPLFLHQKYSFCYFQVLEYDKDPFEDWNQNHNVIKIVRVVNKKKHYVWLPLGVQQTF